MKKDETTGEYIPIDRDEILTRIIEKKPMYKASEFDPSFFRRIDPKEFETDEELRKILRSPRGKEFLPVEHKSEYPDESLPSSRNSPGGRSPDTVPEDKRPEYNQPEQIDPRGEIQNGKSDDNQAKPSDSVRPGPFRSGPPPKFDEHDFETKPKQNTSEGSESSQSAESSTSCPMLDSPPNGAWECKDEGHRCKLVCHDGYQASKEVNIQ